MTLRRYFPADASRRLGLVGALLLLLANTAAGQALRHAQIFDDGHPHLEGITEPASSLIQLAWPFCPTDRMPCSEGQLAWVTLGVTLDAYSQRRNDPHDSISRIVNRSRDDLAPLAAALREYFENNDIQSDARRVAAVQGLVEAVVYDADATTGWTEYPKFGIEFFVDEQGDCDDAAITSAVLLEGLGYRSWFVEWTGPEGGHLSTAIAPDQGDLASVVPPEGSEWIQEPGGRRLLHVDSTGATSGCGKAWVQCGGLGWNEWSQKQLQISQVVRADDPDLEERLPISAWNNGGLQKPSRTFMDRRGASENEVVIEVRQSRNPGDRTLQRLSMLGLDTTNAKRYLTRSRGPSKIFTFIYYMTCLTVVATSLSLTWRDRRRRLARAALFADKRKRKRF